MTHLTSGHLVVLSGQGDTDVKIVGPATFAWINSDYNYDGSDEETPSADVLTEFKLLDTNFDLEELPFYITSGSYDNDRALRACGKSFDSATAAVKWAMTNNIELGAEYHGYIY